MKKPFAPIVMMVALLGLALAPAESRADVPLPEQAINQNAAVVIWADLSQITPASIRATVQHVNAALPEEMAQSEEQLTAQLDENMVEFTQMHDQVTGAGVQGVLIVVQMPAPAEGVEADPMAAPPEPKPAMFLRVAPGTTPEAVAAAVQQVRPQEPVNLVAYADQWLAVQEEDTVIPEDGTADQAEAFANIFAEAGEAPIQMAFRVTPTMRQTLTDQKQQAAGGPFMGFTNSLEALDHGWATVTLGEQPRIVQTLDFTTVEAANQFNAAWQGLLMMGQGMLQGQLAQLPEPPPVDAIQNLVQSLQMTQDGTKLTLTLGDPFITHVAQLSPAFGQLFMITMMMQGGGPPMGPGMEQPADEGQGDGQGNDGNMM